MNLEIKFLKKRTNIRGFCIIISSRKNGWEREGGVVNHCPPFEPQPFYNLALCGYSTLTDI